MTVESIYTMAGAQLPGSGEGASSIQSNILLKLRRVYPQFWSPTKFNLWIFKDPLSSQKCQI